ncbi:MAG: hypothetical protein N2379_02995 [Verrucomicrobiae bacterium]|nr:hypothetical protein [Verrucomicrobiae bacterium]
MQPLLAIARLTWKAAFRFKLFVVLTVLLLVVVVCLPIIIKDDGTARGFTQILLTYTLSSITALLGLCTLWIACGTLARDIEECQIQLVAVKPVARWQIWLGKWLGTVSLNAALLCVSGAAVYALLHWRAARLPEDQRQILRSEVLVARGSVKPPTYDAEIEAATEELLRERLGRAPLSAFDIEEVRKQIREQVKAEYQLVPPGTYRVWEVNLGPAKNFVRNKPMHLRIKFNTAQYSPSGTFTGMWQVGVPDTPRLWRSEPMSLAPETFHEFQIPANLFDEDGNMFIAFLNMSDTALLFPLEEGIEVLYPAGGFTLNYMRALGIIFCWMTLLATLGLTAASFLSFPVAAFFSMAVLIVAFSTGTMSSVVTEGTVGLIDTAESGGGPNILDAVLVPLFAALLKIVNLARAFSPIDLLSTGRSIPWTELLRAIGQIVILLGGVLAAVGIFSFSRRELASGQATQ